MASTKKSSRRKSQSMNRRQPYMMARDFKFEKKDDVEQLAMWAQPAKHARNMALFFVIRGYLRCASYDSNTCFPDDITTLVLKFFDLVNHDPHDQYDGCPELILQLFHALSLVPPHTQMRPALPEHIRLANRIWFEMLPALSADMTRHYAILKLLQHKYIVRIDVEPMERKSLHDYVVRKKRLCEDRAREITTMLLEAVEFLHSRDVVHGNLSPLNVRLADATDRSIIKVCFENHAAYPNKAYTAPEVIHSGCADLFGYRKCQTCDKSKSATCGRWDKNSRMWFCSVCWPQKTPQPARDYRCFDFPVDVWVIGAITFRMLFGWDYRHVRNEYRGTGKYRAKFNQGIYDFLNKKKQSLGDVCVGFVDSLLENKPQDRPSAAKALQHPWIKTGYADTKEARKRQRSPSPVYVRPRFSAK